MNSNQAITGILAVLCLLSVVPGGALAESTIPADTTDVQVPQQQTENPEDNESADGEESDGNTTDSDSESDTASDSDRVQRASLEILQPNHVESDVQTQQKDNRNIYDVSGAFFRLVPQNFNNQNVVDSGVEENNGVLTFNERTGEYEFDTQGKSATYTVYWVVEEDVEVETTSTDEDGNETTTTTTETRATRYEAQLNVESADYAHIPSGEYAETESKADKWDSLVLSELSEFVDTDDEQAVESLVSVGMEWAKLAADPAYIFKGGLITFLTVNLLTPGVLFWFASLGIMVLAVIYKLYRDKNKLEEGLGSINDVAQERIRQWAKKSRQLLSAKDPADKDVGLPFEHAEAFRQHAGDNLYQIGGNILRTLSPDQIKAYALGGMHTAGYALAVKRTDDAVVDVTPVETPDDYTGDDESELVSIDDIGAEEVAAVELEELDFAPLRKGVDITVIPPTEHGQYTSSNELVEDWMADVGADLRREFDNDPTEWADGVAAVLQSFTESDYTDIDGEVRAEMDIANAIYAISQTCAEEYRMPYLEKVQRCMIHIADEPGLTDRINDHVESSRRDGLALDTGPGRSQGTDEGSRQTDNSGSALLDLDLDSDLQDLDDEDAAGGGDV